MLATNKIIWGRKTKIKCKEVKKKLHISYCFIIHHLLITYHKHVLCVLQPIQRNTEKTDITTIVLFTTNSSHLPSVLLLMDSTYLHCSRTCILGLGDNHPIQVDKLVSLGKFAVASCRQILPPCGFNETLQRHTKLLQTSVKKPHWLDLLKHKNRDNHHVLYITV